MKPRREELILAVAGESVQLEESTNIRLKDTRRREAGELPAGSFTLAREEAAVHVSARGWIVAAVTAILVGSPVSLSGQAGADETEPPVIVSYRQALMRTNAQRLGALRALTSGEIDLPEHGRLHSAALAGNARMMMTRATAGIHDVFPAGSAHATSRASEEIWERAGEFTERVRNFSVAANSLNEAAQGGSMEQIREAIAEVGRACSGCHQEFRLPATGAGS